jgi:hypothetical protein
MSGKGGGSKDNPKKPSAIIDLKATEVKSSKPAAGAGSAADKSSGAASAKAGSPTGTASALKASASTGKASQTTAAPAASAAGSDKKPAASGAATAGATAAAGTAAGAAAAAKSGSGGTGGASRAGDGGRGGGGSPPPSAKPEKRRGGGILGMISHLVAAVIGGAVVLYGGADMAKQAGLPVPPRTAEVPAEVTERLASLEQKVEAPATAPAELPDDVKTQLAAVQSQSETIAALQKTIDELKAAQADVATKVEQVAETASSGAPAGASEEVTKRIAQLEQTIETLSKAAGNEGTGGGRIAQLAALSGKLTDLESTLQTQLATLRQTVMSDIDKRLAPAAQASEAARSGTQRVDRELAETKTEVARLAQRTEALSATTNRIDESLRVVREETGKLASDVTEIKGDLKSQIATRATPKDIETAIKPIGEKVASLETGLDSVLKSEVSRKADAERVVVALQLANLKRALDRGGSFADELGEVKAAAGEGLDVSALDPYKGEGVATISRLSAELKSLSHDIISAAQTNTEGGWVDQMLQGAKSIVRVRRTGEVVGADPNSAEAIVAKLEQQVAAGDLAAASETASKLPETSKVAASGWLKRLEARAAVDRAIAKVEADLKSSLTGTDASKS